MRTALIQLVAVEVTGRGTKALFVTLPNPTPKRYDLLPTLGTANSSFCSCFVFCTEKPRTRRRALPTNRLSRRSPSMKADSPISPGEAWRNRRHPGCQHGHRPGSGAEEKPGPCSNYQSRGAGLKAFRSLQWSKQE